MTFGTVIAAGTDDCPSWAPAFGYMGAALCAILANFGSAWGTWRAGLGVCAMGIDHPRGIMKNIVPIVMAGVLGIYGLIVAVIITQAIRGPSGDDGKTVYSVYNAFGHLAAGLCCGLSCLAAGGTIGMIGDISVRCFGIKATGGKRCWDSELDDNEGQQEARNGDDANRLYVGSLIMLIFAEALALYGLIVALILTQKTYYCETK